MISLEAVQKTLDAIEHSEKAAQSLRALSAMTEGEDAPLSTDAMLLAKEIEARERTLRVLVRRAAGMV